MDSGWAWVVMVASFLATFVAGILVYSVGVLHVALLETFHEDNSKTAWVGSLHTSLQMLAGPVSGAVVGWLGCRASMCMGGMTILLGCSLSALADNVDTILATYGLIGGFGLSLMYLPAIVVVSYHFERHRGLASGVSVTGGGLGMFAGGPIIRRLLDTYGLRGTYLLLGAIGFHNCLFGMLARPSTLEKRLRRLSKERERKIALTHGVSRWRKIMESLTSYLTLFKNYAFLCHSLSVLLWNMGFAAVVLCLPGYSQSLGSSPSQAAALFTGTGISSILARFLTGVVLSSKNNVPEKTKALEVPRNGMGSEEGPEDAESPTSKGKEHVVLPDFDCLTMHFSGLGLSGLATLLFPVYASSYLGQMAFACMFGLYSGMPIALFAPLTVELVGVERLASAFGFETLFMGVGYGLGPPIAGAIVDAGGTYAHAFVFAGAVTLLGSLLSFVTCLLHSKGRPASPCHSAQSVQVEVEVAVLGSLRFLPPQGSLSFLSSTASLHFAPEAAEAGSMRLERIGSCKVDRPSLSLRQESKLPRATHVTGDSLSGLVSIQGEPLIVSNVEEVTALAATE